MADTTNRKRPLMIERDSTPGDEGIQTGPVAIVILAYAGGCP
jgi:hypothetical protein